jgi:hypothetical protein
MSHRKRLVPISFVTTCHSALHHNFSPGGEGGGEANLECVYNFCLILKIML